MVKQTITLREFSKINDRIFDHSEYFRFYKQLVKYKNMSKFLHFLTVCEIILRR